VPAGDGRSIITVEQLALLSRSLEFGMCDHRLLAQLFEQLDVNPEALLPQELPLLSQTAFFLWKSGGGDFAKSLLFTCLAWCLRHSRDPSDARSTAENLQYMFAKEDHRITAEQIEQQARDSQFVNAASWKSRRALGVLLS
jgi:hypothetical protein